MPAPDKASLKAAFRAAFIKAGPEKFAKRDAQGAIVPGALQPALEDMIDAFAEGLANEWLVWQAAQVVTGTASGVVTGGSTVPVFGQLP